MVSFSCKDTKALHERRSAKRFGALESVARRKLAMLDAAASLKDLASPPGNHLEALRDDRAGQHSIRINKQFRICFVWTDDGPKDVEIVDYH
ncbi:MAG: type II toxin-antitoxin system RelE/ParE family toxin [Rhizobium sp.]|nr:type II toxin-antitoxin system RelE/ParE family toxin [Rhizobium sp.]